jgi:hypothetical protein
MKQITGKTCIDFVPCKGAHEKQYETLVGSTSKRTINCHLNCDPDEKPKRRATPNVLPHLDNIVVDAFNDARNVSSVTTTPDVGERYSTFG